MSTPEEYAFLQLLRRVEKEKYVPNLGERAVLCRTFNSEFNPIGPYFASVGALCGFLGANQRQSLSWKMIGMLLCSLYSFELSWAFQDQNPCCSFFNDIRAVDGELRVKSNEYQLTGGLDHNHRRPLSIIFDFLTLDRTVRWLVSSRSISVNSMLWLPHLRIEWFDGLPLDPLTIWYWGFTLPRQKSQTR